MIAGRSRCWSASQNVDHCPASSASTVYMPVTCGGATSVGDSRDPPGKMPSLKKKQVERDQRQPEGRHGDADQRQDPRARQSVKPSRRSAASRPKPTPKTSAITIETIASSAVAGIVCARSWMTESPVCSRRAEVAVHQVLEVDPELDRQRLVEPVLLVKRRGSRLASGSGPGSPAPGSRAPCASARKATTTMPIARNTSAVSRRPTKRPKPRDGSRRRHPEFAMEVLLLGANLSHAE